MSNLVRTLSVFVVCAVVFSLAGCGKREEPSQPPPEQQTSSPAAQPSVPAFGQQAPPSAPGAPAQPTAPTAMPTMPSPDMDFEKMAAEQAAALKAMNQGKDIQPISLDKLKGFLPETVAGMERGQSDGRQVNMMGVKVASAQVDYVAGENGILEIMIMDVGNISGPMRMSMTGWTMMQIDQQTDTGYEKTTTHEGYKAIEQYDRQDQHGEFRVFVADRFIVEITGDNVTMETIKGVMGQIDLKKLAEAAK